MAAKAMPRIPMLISVLRRTDPLSTVRVVERDAAKDPVVAFMGVQNEARRAGWSRAGGLRCSGFGDSLLDERAQTADTHAFRHSHRHMIGAHQHIRYYRHVSRGGQRHHPAMTQKEST